MKPQDILVERRGRVGLIVLNRPKSLNALSSRLLAELAHALDAFEADDAIGCIVLTGGERAFAAGADIKELASKSFLDAYAEDLGGDLVQRTARCRKPVIAAVAGYALGGGCELAMMCDFIIAADNAKFGQPEITIGTIPGYGGTQRLTRFVGKSKAMEMILTGRHMGAEEAERAGLVSRIVPSADLLEEALRVADRIAQHSHPITMMAKECVNMAYESTLAAGIIFERRVFHTTFATEDQKEGMAAFQEKRSPTFQGK